MAADTDATARQLTPRGVVFLMVMQNAAFCALGVLLWHWSGREPVEMVDWASPLGWLGGIALGLAFIAVAWGVCRAFPHMSDRFAEWQANTYRGFGRDLGWPAIVTVAFAAGIGEEVLLRGGLQTWLTDHVGPMWAILLASAAFAALHLARPIVTALLFVIGIVFGWIYWATDSLLMVMLAHAIYDVWAIRTLLRQLDRLGLFEAKEEPGAALVNGPEPG